MDTTTKKLLAVEVRDFKRVRYCRIDFTEAVTLIGGRNSQGKSSLLDGIRAAAAGDKDLPADPIRDGADEARLFLDFGVITVEKVLSDGSTKLVVKDDRGKPLKKPQSVLDEMLGNALWFDPLEFLRMNDKQQDM